MIHSFSIQGPITKSYKKYFTVMKLSRTTVNYHNLARLMDRRSLWHMIWTYHRLHTNNTRRWVRIRIKVQRKTFQKVEQGRFSQLQIKKGINHWVFRELLVACKTQLIKRHHSKTTADSKTIIQIRVDRIPELQTLRPPAPTKFRAANQTRVP